MDAKSFRGWLCQLGELSNRQCEQLKHRLLGGAASDDARDWINRRAQESLACPHCQAAHVQRWGRESGIQRYRCGDCHRTFNALTGSPLAGLKYREAWADYTKAMIDGCSLRVAARRSGVHASTAFRWRHRLLQGPDQAQDTELHNIVEADETYFLESFKGQRKLPRPARHRGGSAAKRGLSAEQIPVLVVEDREGHHFDAVVHKVDLPTIGCLLAQVLAPDALLCSDGAGVYRATVRQFKLAHESVNVTAGQYVRQQIFHVQHVIAYDSHHKQWIRRFNGVATHYLPNYLGWRRLIERCAGKFTPEIFLRHAVG